MTSPERERSPHGGEDALLMEQLAQRLGPAGLVLEAGDMAPFERSSRHAGGRARGVLLPATAEDLAWTVRTLAMHHMPFVVQGAATGLVAAATPTPDARQWVISTRRLKDCLEIDPVNRSARVSAGVLLSELNRRAAEHGLFFPIDLGADPSIGGMVATNTGGARLIRYGGVRENLMAVQAVLRHPPGLSVGDSRALRKDNTGLQWTQLLCGTFGAFGVITQATVRLHLQPQQTATALLAVDSVDSAVRLLGVLEASLGDFVSAYEGISGAALQAVLAHFDDWPSPFEQPAPYAVLVELASATPAGGGLDLQAMLMAWLEDRFEAQGSGLIDAVVDKPERLWRLRHALSEAVQSRGKMIAFDLSVSRSAFASFRARALEIVQAHLPQAQVYDFGHLGDGGVHLNMVVPPDTDVSQMDALRALIYDTVVREFAGSYSAEHGIGPYNQAYHARFAEPALRQVAQALHGQLDPDRQMGNVQLD